MDVRGALHGRGNFELASPAKHLFVPHEAWIGMSEEQRKKWMNNFFKFHPPSNTQSSTDGSLTIPSTARIAKKPGQVKRVRNAKTTSIPNKKLKIPVASSQ